MAIDLSIEIALLLERWQGIVNMMAQVAEVPCVLINGLDKNEICVQAVGSVSKPAFYCDEPIPLALNSYCSQVIASHQPLLVENAIGTRYENNNPTFAAGFSYYYGLPLLWPSGETFGTLCMLDRASADRASQHCSLLTLFKQAIEYDLQLLQQQQEQLKREQQADLKFIQLFNEISNRIKPVATNKLLQSELFVLLTSQYQYWHQELELQLNQTVLAHENSIHIAALVRIWSNLVAIAHETEWLRATAVAEPYSCEAEASLVDATPLLEQAVYKTALTLGTELVLRSHLPNPLLLSGRPELWSLIGLAITSFLVIGASGTSKTVFVSSRIKGKHRVLEWSLHVKGQTMPLHFTRDNQALYGFASVCAELAGAVLESGEQQLTESIHQQSSYLNSNRDHVDDIESRNASRTRFICLWIPVVGDDL